MQGAKLAVRNPATLEIVGEVGDASIEDLDAAVAACRRAWPGWRDLSLDRRRAVVAALGARLAAHADELAAMLTAEQGKPLADAKGEILGAAGWLQAVSEQELPVRIVEDSDIRRTELRHVPLGVVGAIAPWNFPIILALWKVAPALVTGNCVLLKPSPFTPLTTCRIAQIASEIVPSGVFSVITGGDQLGPWLTAHSGIDKISFTGSTQTGRKVMASASTTLKRVTLELGGNDPAIIFPDVDIEAVVPDLFWAAFRNSGQICIASKRIYVHADIYERFRDAFVAYAQTVRMGDGAREGIGLGPVQNAPQFDRVKALVADCRANGFTIFTGRAPEAEVGYFMPVTIIDNPPDDSRIVREEPFGPVVPLLRFETIDEVIARANASDFGLAGSVWSRDPDLARSVASALECGTVWVNEVQHITPETPFGGHKQSGLGVEGGAEGLREYTNAQVISVRKPAPQSE